MNIYLWAGSFKVYYVLTHAVENDISTILILIYERMTALTNAHFYLPISESLNVPFLLPETVNSHWLRRHLPKTDVKLYLRVVLHRTVDSAGCSAMQNSSVLWRLDSPSGDCGS